MYEIYADNSFIDARKDLESCLAIVKYLYENYDYTRIRIERRVER